MLSYQKKQLFLISIIYLAFVSLGLPDGILGVAWPSMRMDFGMPLESMGILTALLLCLSAFSSMMSGRLQRRLGTGGVTLLSGLMTGIALLGVSLTPSFFWLAACVIPLGLGQGASDTVLNQYVAEHYSSRHMNWLHCFWGVGASLGPILMTCALLNSGWRSGYQMLSGIQLTLSAVLLISLVIGLWRGGQEEESVAELHNVRDPEVGLSGIWEQVAAVILFFLYAGIEFSMGLWLNSVLVESRQLPVTVGGMAVSVYYGSIMVGRFLSGMVVNRIGNPRMIRLGLLLAAAGGALVGISQHDGGMLAGVIMVGLGMAPVYPCLMHETPNRFKKKISDRLIGYQVGAACLGGSVVSMGVGLLLSRVSLELLFPVVIALLLLALTLNELLRARAKQSIGR